MWREAGWDPRRLKWDGIRVAEAGWDPSGAGPKPSTSAEASTVASASMGSSDLGNPGSVLDDPSAATLDDAVPFWTCSRNAVSPCMRDRMSASCAGMTLMACVYASMAASHMACTDAHTRQQAWCRHPLLPPKRRHGQGMHGAQGAAARLTRSLPLTAHASSELAYCIHACAHAHKWDQLDAKEYARRRGVCERAQHVARAAQQTQGAGT